MFEVWGICFPLVGFLSLLLHWLLEQRVNIRPYPSWRLIILLMISCSCPGASLPAAAGVQRLCSNRVSPGVPSNPESRHCCAHHAPSSGHKCLTGSTVLPLSFHAGASGVLKNSKGFMYLELISISRFFFFFPVMRKSSQLG